MKTLYLECNMGAAGDMLAAALLELHPQPDEVVCRLNHIGLPGVEFFMEPSVKCGITGSHFRVCINGMEEKSADHGHGHHEYGQGTGHFAGGQQEHMHEFETAGHGPDCHEYTNGPGAGHTAHEHHGLHEIGHIVSELDLPESVRKDIMAVYQLIAEAESKVHGRPVEQVHFHEVGALDAVADVAAVCLLLHELAPDRIIASPVHVGSGQVRCAHGILPVPAPATELLLRDIPSYGGSVWGELCTPTGAALLKYFCQEFDSRPVMRVKKTGYGMGKKDFEQANCIRAMWGETDGSKDSEIELRCNLDDMTPEGIGFAMECLMEAGALDVYTIPVGMKKNRPGVLLTCMCRMEQRKEMIRLLFLHTTTLGLRENVCSRYTLERSVDTLESIYGPVRMKRVSGWGAVREKAEYEDIARIAREQGISLQQVNQAIGHTKKEKRKTGWMKET